MSPALLLLLPSPVLAATVVDYSENFDSYTTSSFTGTGGWVSGTASDPWSAASGDGVYATTDENGGTYGSGGYADNHLRYTGQTWSDFTLDVVVNSNDDDTIGVVFRYSNAQNYYLAFWSNNYIPGTGTGAVTATTGQLFLYKVSGGSATALDSYTAAYTASVDYNLRVVAKGSTLTVWADLDRDNVWDSGEDVLSATDTAFTSGNVGFYCYDNGSGSGCVFDDLKVSLDDTDGDGVADEDDNCDATSNPSQTDTDGDGSGDACDSDADGDGYTSGADCNDLSSAVKPGATETCDGVDQDCDGVTDDGTTCYDDDGDGYTEAGGDCDDAKSSISPKGTETCDGVDQDCDGAADDGATDATTWYTDGDADGYGDSSAKGTTACTAPSGTVSTSGDCDDAASGVHPGVTEVCDGVDQDCDSTADDGLATSTWYTDDDGDGWGETSTGVTTCGAPSGGVSTGGDCDDGDEFVNPGASEVCDGIDQDCDGNVDDGAPGSTTWFLDFDDDGFGDPNTFVDSCVDLSDAGWVEDEGDCDDGDAAVNPDADEIPDNGADEDCDGEDGSVDTDPGDTDTGGDTDPEDTDTGGDTDTGAPGDTDTGEDRPATSARSWDPSGEGGPAVAGAGCGCASPGSGVPMSLAWVTLVLIVGRRRGQR